MTWRCYDGATKAYYSEMEVMLGGSETKEGNVEIVSALSLPHHCNMMVGKR